MVAASILDSRYLTSTPSHTVCQQYRNRDISYAFYLVEMSGSTKLRFCSMYSVFMALLASIKVVIFIKRLIQIFGSSYNIPRETQSQTEN